MIKIYLIESGHLVQELKQLSKFVIVGNSCNLGQLYSLFISYLHESGMAMSLIYRANRRHEIEVFLSFTIPHLNTYMDEKLASTFALGEDHREWFVILHSILLFKS